VCEGESRFYELFCSISFFYKFYLNRLINLTVKNSTVETTGENITGENPDPASSTERLVLVQMEGRADEKRNGD
jgi:hypothetical protein